MPPYEIFIRKDVDLRCVGKRSANEKCMPKDDSANEGVIELIRARLVAAQDRRQNYVYKQKRTHILILERLCYRKYHLGEK